MTPTHAVKTTARGVGGAAARNERTKRYRYYISRALVMASRSQMPGGRRIPAGDIKQLVVDRLCRYLTDRGSVHDALSAHSHDAAELEQLIARAVELGQSWSKRSVVEQRVMISSRLERIDIGADGIDIHLDRARLPALLRGDQRKRPANRSEPRPATDTIVLDELSARETLTGSYATRLLRLTFLAPDLVRDILDGGHPPMLTANTLMADTRLSLAWSKQRSRLAACRP